MIKFFDSIYERLRGRSQASDLAENGLKNYYSDGLGRGVE